MASLCLPAGTRKRHGFAVVSVVLVPPNALALVFSNLTRTRRNPRAFARRFLSWMVIWMR